MSDDAPSEQPFDLIPAVHPGPFFKSMVLKWAGCSPAKAAAEMKMDVKSLENFLNGNASVNGQLAEKLQNFSGISKNRWLDMQANYDLSNRPDSKSKNFLLNAYLEAGVFSVTDRVHPDDAKPV